MKQHTVGIDISKAHLDAYRLADGESGRFDNDLAGIEALIDWIGTPVECVAYEATGAYHRDLEHALFRAGLAQAKVNPWQARRYAEATGTRAKTDAVDARILAQMAAAVEPRRTAAPSKTQRRLKELQMSRDALIRQRTAVLNRRRLLCDPLLKRQHQTQINLFERHLRAVDRKNAEADRGGSGASPKTGDPDLDSRDRGHHGRGSAGRDAGARHAQRQDRRESGRTGGGSAGVRSLEGPSVHPGRTGAGAADAVHAGRGRPALEPRHGSGVRETERARQARQGGPRRRHAQADRPGQYPGWAGPDLVPRRAPRRLLTRLGERGRKGEVRTRREGQ